MMGRTSWGPYALWLSLLFNGTFLWMHVLTPRGRGGRSETPKAPEVPSEEHAANGTGRDPDLWSAHHSLRLTHVVMPFHISHLSKLEQNVRTWLSYVPCHSPPAQGGQQRDQSPPDPRFAAPPHYRLVFYSSTDMRKRDKIAEIDSRLHALMGNLSEPVRACFASWQILHANLSAHSDTYYRGTRLMLEKLLLNKLNLNATEPGRADAAAQAPQYVFYMEPDCLPVRRHWLHALDWQCRWPNAPFWLKGSIYRGSNKGVYATRHPPQFFHINGNALINLQDRSLRAFYVKHYRPWVQAAAAVRERSFDTDFWRFLHNLDSIHVVKPHYHKFQTTDVVQNWWRSSYSVSRLREDSPGTYLVHGGYPKP